jgi:hypothetical protein
MFKKALLLFFFFILLLFSGHKLEAQIIKGEAILGMNLSQVDGDEVYGFKKIGANVGGGVLVPFGKRGRWDASFEVLYNQVGSKQNQQYYDSTLFTCDGDTVIVTGEYKLNLHYMTIPVMVMFTDKEFISFGAGFSWSYLVGVKEWEQGNLVTGTTLNSGTYNKNDFRLLADLRVKIYKSLKFNLRYQYSLLKIRTREFKDLNCDTWTRNQFNNIITFRLIWVFNEEQSRKNFQNIVPKK